MELRDEASQVGRTLTHGADESVQIQAEDHVSEDLNPRPEGRGLLPFPAPPSQHPALLALGETRQLPHETRLPDTCFPADNVELSPTGLRLTERSTKLSQFPLPADEDTAGQEASTSRVASHDSDADSRCTQTSGRFRHLT